MVVAAGNKYRFESIIAALFYSHPMLAKFSKIETLVVDRLHVAEAEVGVDTDFVADPAAEEGPHRKTNALAQDVPECMLGAVYGCHANDAQPIETLLLHCLDALLHIARVAPDEEWRQILNR